MTKARRSWFGAVRRKFLRSPTRPRETIIVLHINNTCSSLKSADKPPPPSPTTVTKEDVLTSCHVDTRKLSSTTHSQKHDNLSVEEVAATKIQAYFRRHLARRAYKALKSLVKLQAVVRGVYTRRQARLALECMNALVRLQVTVRARQHLLTPHQLQPI